MTTIYLIGLSLAYIGVLSSVAYYKRIIDRLNKDLEQHNDLVDRYWALRRRHSATSAEVEHLKNVIDLQRCKINEKTPHYGEAQDQVNYGRENLIAWILRNLYCCEIISAEIYL